MGRNLGVGRSAYSKIEAGNIELTIKHLQQLAQRFDVSLDWLITGRGAASLDSQEFREFGDFAETAKQIIDDMRKSKLFMHTMFCFYFKEKLKQSIGKPPDGDNWDDCA